MTRDIPNASAICPRCGTVNREVELDLNAPHVWKDCGHTSAEWLTLANPDILAGVREVVANHLTDQPRLVRLGRATRWPSGSD